METSDKYQALKKAGADVDLIVTRMNINALLVDVLNTNSMEIEALLKKTKLYRYKQKQEIKKLIRTSINLLRELDKQFTSEDGSLELCETFGEMADYIFEVVNLAASVREEKRIQVLSTLKLIR